MTSRPLRAAALAAAFLASAACSIRRTAIENLGDALAEGGGGAYASDDDPDLVRNAAPFSLKLMESLLAETPEHKGLLLAATSGFTQYAYAFVEADADDVEDRDLDAALALRARARRLYLRARGYGLRGLDVAHADFAKSLRADPRKAVRTATKDDVPLLYWTSAAWMAAISLSKDSPSSVADLPIAVAMLDRALELDETFDRGAIHALLVSYEPSRPDGQRDAAARARRHFDRAVELSGGALAAPYVALAESVSVPAQNRTEFESLLRRALAIDADAEPTSRLANLVMQRRARRLLANTDRLILDDVPKPETP